jgi:hypothetical protein
VKLFPLGTAETAQTALTLLNHPLAEAEAARMKAMNEAPCGSIRDRGSLNGKNLKPHTEIFQGFQLYHNNFFRVPARQAVVFQVGIDVQPFISSIWDAGGDVVVDFSTGDGFLLCPFVETRDVRYWHIADIRGTATICPLLG